MRPPNDVVLITGASDGIGRAVARGFATHGSSLILAARRAERLADVAAELRSVGASVVTCPVDVSLDAGRKELVTKAISTFGKIDVLVNNAGYGYRCPLETTPLHAVRSIFETNVFAPIALTQLVVPHMRDQRRGCIINMSSVAGKVARPLSSLYDATKHALEAVSDGLVGELRDFGICVVVIEPGFVKTEFVAVADSLSTDYSGNDGNYDRLRRAMRESDARYRRFAVSPEKVAQVVVRAAIARRSGTRYVVPLFARVTLLLKRLLPHALFQRVIGG